MVKRGGGDQTATGQLLLLLLLLVLHSWTLIHRKRQSRARDHYRIHAHTSAKVCMVTRSQFIY